MVSALACLVPLLELSEPEPGTARFPLNYDQALVDADFPSPAVRLVVNGQAAWFLVDTGAGVHMIASWFVDKAKLKVDAMLDGSARAIDSTGRSAALRAVRGIEGRMENGGLMALGTVWVTEFPPDFERSNVGGVVSPQLLPQEGHAAVLDLRVPELSLEPLAAALRRLEATALPRAKVRVCGSRSGAVPNLSFAIATTVGPREAFLTLDTGAGRTKIAARSALVRGVTLVPGGQTLGVTGQAQAYSVVRGLRLSFADSTATLDARVAELPDDECGSDGLLGLDALAGCTLVASDEALAVRCRR